jgi:hypothetical protein
MLLQGMRVTTGSLGARTNGVILGVLPRPSILTTVSTRTGVVLILPILFSSGDPDPGIPANRCLVITSSDRSRYQQHEYSSLGIS